MVVGSSLIRYRGTWDSSTSYKLGDVVLRSGVLYQAANDTTSTPGTTAIVAGHDNPGAWVNVSTDILELTGSTDPTAGAGVPAAIGSTYQQSGVGLLSKTGAGATTWTSGGGGGGGGVTVTGPDGTSVSATEIQTSGRVVDAGGGVAQLPGTVLKVLLSADGNGTIPSTDSFTTITLAALYDPDGYFHATNMPNENLPGLKVPVGNGGIHRIMFYASLLNGGGDVDTRVYTAIGFDSFGDTTDILRFVDGAPPPGKPYALIAAFTADLDDGEEMYFYSKNNTGSAIEIRPQTHVTLERLADPL